MSRFHNIEDEIRMKGIIEPDDRIDTSNSGMYIHFHNNLYVQVFNGIENENYGLNCIIYQNENMTHNDLINKIEEIAYCSKIENDYRVKLQVICQYPGASLYLIKESKNNYIVLLKDISVYGINSIEKIIKDIEGIEINELIIDWHDLYKLCSHYMNSIFRLKKIVENKLGKIILINVNNKTMQVLKLTGEDSIYDFKDINTIFSIME